MILQKPTQPQTPVIDLTGPQGNAFVLMGIARQWGNQMGLNVPNLIDEMKSGDYENLVKVFDREFGSFCILYR